MVTTRSQVVAVKHRPRSRSELLASPSRTHAVAKTVVQKRQQMTEEANRPKTTTIRSCRKTLCMAPQLGNHILFLFIGEQRQLITIHSDLLPESVKAYIQQRSQGLQTYQLPDEDVSVVQIYRLFLYTNRIFSISDIDQDLPDNGRSEAHSDAEWTKLAHCYLFGITVKDEGFANACVTAIIEKMEDIDRYPTGIAGEVYAYTTEGDRLRRLIVDIHVFKGLGHWVRPPHDDADGPKEFLQDVISGLAAAGPGVYEEDWVMPWIKSACEYHSHEVTGGCE